METRGSATEGNDNVLVRLSEADASEIGQRKAMLRIEKARSFRKKRSFGEKGAHDSAQSTFLAYQLGEAGVAPRVLAAWMPLDARGHQALPMHTVSELFDTSLLKQISKTNESVVGAAQALLHHIDFIANLGLILLDLHPGNVLLRRRDDGRWDARLTDVDVKFVIHAPDWSPICRKLVMLSILAVTFVCGKYPRTAFQNEIASLANTTSVRVQHCGAVREFDALGRVQVKKRNMQWNSAIAAEGVTAEQSHRVGLIKLHLTGLGRNAVLDPDSPCKGSSATGSPTHDFSVSGQGLLKALKANQQRRSLYPL